MIKVIDKNGNQKIYSTGTGGGGGGGGVSLVSTASPLTGGPITSSGTIGITQATTSTNGYLSSTDWNKFNNKQDAVTRQHQFVSGTIAKDYNGHAPVGSVTSAAVWTIYKLEIAADGSSVFYHADDNPTAIWDNRATLTYSV